MKVFVPPIKCQGIKTKLVPAIVGLIDRHSDGLWIEPFLGSGVVVLNVLPKRALLADTNPHLVGFYQAIQEGRIDCFKVRRFLEREGNLLAIHGAEHYYRVRDRFNSTADPLDFLFLNRSCFNGLIRFNRRGLFNVPFGHKPFRFSPAYITKIVNQIDRFKSALQMYDWQFMCQGYADTIAVAEGQDFIYCDPPYVGRHVDYYHDWDASSELELCKLLKETDAKFLLSTWHSNQHRENPFVHSLWKNFNVFTREHFYHVGAREVNRKPMLEALVANYASVCSEKRSAIPQEQMRLLEEKTPYGSSWPRRHLGKS